MLLILYINAYGYMLYFTIGAISRITQNYIDFYAYNK